MSDLTSPLLAGIDAGGTTFKCGIAAPDGTILSRMRVPVTSPDETIAQCVNYFREQSKTLGGELQALGIASFGPIDIDPASQSYGTILDTPKLGWSNTNLHEKFSKQLGVDVAVDTDVNGALSAELAWGAAVGVSRAAYITVGTGIGAAISLEGRFAGSPLHPEFGHIRVQRHPEDRSFSGSCSFHGDCLEGLASATAFTERFGSPEALDANHPGWMIEAYYLAQACWSLSLSVRPQRIVLGGGLMLAPHLITLIREQYAQLSASYLSESPSDIRAKLVIPGLGDDAGLFGGIRLVLPLVAAAETN